MSHPRNELSAAFQTPLRLSLMAAVGRDEVTFGTLKLLLEASDSQLSKAIAHLEGEEYLRVRKGYAGARPCTWVGATAAGRRAFEAHLAALAEISRGYLDGAGRAD